MATTGPDRVRAPGYHLAHTYTLGGDGGWDYLALDTVGHRLFVARQDRVMVVDPENGKVLREIPGLNRAHGIAFAYETGRGFATSGADSQVTVFDLKTLEVLGHTTAAVDDDAILYDPATRRIFTFNGDAHSASVIDPASSKRVGTVDLGGGPEFAVSDGAGKIYVNLEDDLHAGDPSMVARAVPKPERPGDRPCAPPVVQRVPQSGHGDIGRERRIRRDHAADRPGSRRLSLRPRHAARLRIER